MFDYLVFVVFIAHIVSVAFCLSLLTFVLPSCVTIYYTCTAHALLFLQLCLFSFQFARKWYFVRKVSPKGKAVLITGCDTGFGHHLAKRLDRAGFHVFAACLFPAGVGASKLKETCSEKLQILELDVTQDDSVINAVDFVKKNLRSSELWAIVNNAGIFKGYCFDMCTVQDVKDTMDVNSLGPVRVTKAFLPLLRKNKGRIVNVASLGGRLSSPYMVPYTMSKFAAVAFSECLKQELDNWGIRVISIEPEGFRTPMVDAIIRPSTIEIAKNSLPEDIKDTYEDQYQKKLESLLQMYWKMSSPDISMVVNDLESAISLKQPNSVYKSCRNTAMGIFIYIAVRLPTELRDWTAALVVSFLSPPIKI